jgi:hypothetical protein
MALQMGIRGWYASSYWWSFESLLTAPCFQLVGIHASTNNRSGTVLDGFVKATEVYGFPSRVRGDRGSENTEVSVFMIIYRGPNRGSFIWGT